MKYAIKKLIQINLIQYNTKKKSHPCWEKLCFRAVVVCVKLFFFFLQLHISTIVVKIRTKIRAKCYKTKKFDHVWVKRLKSAVK